MISGTALQERAYAIASKDETIRALFWEFKPYKTPFSQYLIFFEKPYFRNWSMPSKWPSLRIRPHAVTNVYRFNCHAANDC
jgi:hypothetical protein